MIVKFSIRGLCGGCQKQRWFIKNRVYTPKFPGMPQVTSNNQLCGRCFKKILELIGDQRPK